MKAVVQLKNTWLSKLPSKADDSWVQIACDPQLDLGSPSCCSVKGSYCSSHLVIVLGLG